MRVIISIAFDQVKMTALIIDDLFDSACFNWFVITYDNKLDYNFQLQLLVGDIISKLRFLIVF